MHVVTLNPDCRAVAIIALRPSNRHETYGGNGEKRLGKVTFAGKSGGPRCGRATYFYVSASCWIRPQIKAAAAAMKKSPLARAFFYSNL
jgi:hypothetical protein